MTDDPLCLWIKVEVAPEHGSEVRLLDSKLDRVQMRKLADTEPPPVDGGGEDDVAAFRCEVDIFVVLLLIFFLCVHRCIDFIRMRLLLFSQSAFTFLSPS